MKYSVPELHREPVWAPKPFWEKDGKRLYYETPSFVGYWGKKWAIMKNMFREY